MSTNLILSASWAMYDDYKRRKNQPPEIFNPLDQFETDFLVQRIHEQFPQYTPMAVELSINFVRRTLYGGCKRHLFVELVLNNLFRRAPLPSL